jgi:AraC-like DNA-binding protein
VDFVAMFAFGAMAPPWLIVLYLAAYSLAGALTFARRHNQDRTARSYWWPVAALVLMFSIHAAQIVRLAAPDAGQDVVPVVSAMGASLILLALLLAQARTGSAKGGRPYARSTLTRPELERIYAALIRALDGPPPLHRKLDLSLSELCATAGVPAHHASQALSEIGAISFYELLTQRRLAEAQQRLLEPANATVAVEALGMEAGFRSRSAFYAAFKTATGLTPAEFRRRGGEIMSKTAG